MTGWERLGLVLPGNEHAIQRDPNEVTIDV
jgi:hypothetical protein